jgi:hypothetical protein
VSLPLLRKNKLLGKKSHTSEISLHILPKRKRIKRFKSKTLEAVNSYDAEKQLHKEERSSTRKLK